MTVKERILMLRLFERQKKNPKIMNQFGIQIFMQRTTEKNHEGDNKNT